MPETVEEQKPAPKGLTEEYSQVSHIEVDGEKVQVAIGEINEGDDSVNVEVLPGCSDVGLLDTMRRIADETGKPTGAELKDHRITVEPRKGDGQIAK